MGKASQAKPAQSKWRSSLGPLALGVAALVLLVAASAWYFIGANRTAPVATSAPTPVASNAGAPAEVAHLSIVVLPFKNLSGDPGQDYFADGITDNLTTDLSRIRNSFVIASTTAFTYRGKTVDAKEIGKELGVRYVLEGSVQRDQNRVRVSAQLIDAETGAHLWADRFEEDVADLFKLQDQVVARLANALNYELVRAEAETGAHSKNPDVIDLDMRGNEALWRFQQQPTEDSNIAIRALFEQALKIDPNDADALGGDAVTYEIEYAFGWTNPETDYEAKILGQADRAIALARGTLWSYSTKSTYLTITGRPNEGLPVADAALAINPNYAAEYAYRSIAEAALGQFEQAKSDVQHQGVLRRRAKLEPGRADHRPRRSGRGRGFDVRGRSRPVFQVTRRGMRWRAKRRISWPGHDVGRWTRIMVFISTTRAAILTRRRRNVSNCATRHIERLGIDARSPHISQ